MSLSICSTSAFAARSVEKGVHLKKKDPEDFTRVHLVTYVPLKNVAEHKCIILSLDI